MDGGKNGKNERKQEANKTGIMITPTTQVQQQQIMGLCINQLNNN